MFRSRLSTACDLAGWTSCYHKLMSMPSSSRYWGSKISNRLHLCAQPCPFQLETPWTADISVSGYVFWTRCSLKFPYHCSSAHVSVPKGRGETFDSLFQPPNLRSVFLVHLVISRHSRNMRDLRTILLSLNAGLMIITFASICCRLGRRTTVVGKLGYHDGKWSTPSSSLECRL